MECRGSDNIVVTVAVFVLQLCYGYVTVMLQKRDSFPRKSPFSSSRRHPQNTLDFQSDAMAVDYQGVM